MYEITQDTAKPDRSPCLTCERKDMDKSRCAPICQRVDAFRRGYDYSSLPIPDETEIKKSRYSNADVVLCSKCEKHPSSLDDGLCRWCRQVAKRKAAKKKEKAAA
jgi:hypothetical protein